MIQLWSKRRTNTDVKRMMNRRFHVSSRNALALVLIPGMTGALWGFGGSNSNSETQSAREEVVAIIKATAASDEFIPPAAGVGRKDAGRYLAARTAGKLQCGESVVRWEMVNDEYCDCEDGSDEPGTSACEKGKFTFLFSPLFTCCISCVTSMLPISYHTPMLHDVCRQQLCSFPQSLSHLRRSCSPNFDAHSSHSLPLLCDHHSSIEMVNYILCRADSDLYYHSSSVPTAATRTS